MNQGGWLATYIQTWMAQNGDAFMGEAKLIFHSCAILAILLAGAKFALSSAGSGRRDDYTDLGATLTLVFLVQFLLRYYTTPTPVLGGNSVQGLFPAAGIWLEQKVDATALASCVTEIHKVMRWQQSPITMLFDGTQIAGYALLEFCTWLLQGVLMFLSSIAFVFLAIASYVGPLLISVLILPFALTRSLFFGWVKAMLSWSMMGVVASVLAAVWSGAILFGLQTLWHGNYQGLQITEVLQFFTICCVGVCFTALKLESITAQLFGSAAYAAAGFGNYVTRMFRVPVR